MLFLFDSDKVWVEIMGQRHMGGGDITSKETLKPPALDGKAWHPGSKETASWRSVVTFLSLSNQFQSVDFSLHHSFSSTESLSKKYKYASCSFSLLGVSCY